MPLVDKHDFGPLGVIVLSLLACLSAVAVPKPVSAGYFCSTYGPKAPKPWCGGTHNPETELSCSPFNYRCSDVSSVT